MKNLRIVLIGLAIAVLGVACSKSGDDTSGEDSEEAAKGAEGAEGAEGEDESGEAEESADSEDTEEGEESAGADEELEERGMEFMEEVSQAGVENSDDCEAVASEWRELIDDNEDLLEDMRERAQTQTQEEQAAFEERYSDRLGVFMDEMTEVMEKCQDNEEILELVEQLSTR